MEEVDVGAEGKELDQFGVFFQKVEVFFGGELEFLDFLALFIPGLVVDPKIAREMKGLALQHSVLGGNRFVRNFASRVGQILGGAETRQGVGVLEGDARGCPAHGVFAGLLALEAVVSDFGLGFDRSGAPWCA